jgi:ferredoxin-NADP reductase
MTRLVFQCELEQLRRTLNLGIVPVFESPDSAWRGERGHITEALPTASAGQLLRCHYFVYGSMPMMNALETMLMTFGVPAGSIETERFHVV